MSALFTALLESDSKESLAKMVCELREIGKRLADAAEHDMKANQDDEEGHGGWWSLRTEHAIKEMRTALSQLRQEG